MRWQFPAFFLAAIVFPALVHAQENVAEPEGYRTENYRAPVPATLAGARVLTTAEAEAIWRAGRAIFVDVLPRTPKPPNLPPGTVWRDQPRSNIPGSIWLPDTGYGKLAEATEGLPAARTRASFRRQQVGAARDLLPGRLLDVMECGEAGAVLCLFQRGLVPRGNGRVGARRFASRRSAARAAVR